MTIMKMLMLDVVFLFIVYLYNFPIIFVGVVLVVCMFVCEMRMK